MSRLNTNLTLFEMSRTPGEDEDLMLISVKLHIETSTIHQRHQALHQHPGSATEVPKVVKFNLIQRQCFVQQPPSSRRMMDLTKIFLQRMSEILASSVCFF